MSMGLQVHSEEMDNGVILKIEGRLDAASSPLLEEKMLAYIDEGKKHLLFDLTGLEYLSSAGMRLLLLGTKRLKANGGVLALFGIHSDVMEIIKMAGFEEILHIFASKEDALEFVKE